MNATSAPAFGLRATEGADADDASGVAAARAVGTNFVKTIVVMG